MDSREQEIQNLIGQLEELRIAREQISARERRALSRLSTLQRGGERDDTFRAGDYIIITNTVRHRTGGGSSFGDRFATVTRVVGDKVYFVTLNQHRTWRIVRNVRAATGEEIQQAQGLGLPLSQ